MSRKFSIARAHLDSIGAGGTERERFELYRRGRELVQRHGLIDLDDEFELDMVSETWEPDDLKAYLFTWNHLSKKKPAPLSSESQAIQAPRIRHQDKQVDEKPAKAYLAAEALQRFVESKKRQTAPGTAEKYASQCELFLAVAANGRDILHLHQITPDDLRRYVDFLPKLPRKLSPKDFDSSFLGASASVAMSAKTVFSHAQAVHMFLAWCKDQQYPIPIGFDGILKPLLKKPKPSKMRKHFLPHELRAIFGANEYRHGTFKRPSDYWLPILAIFTGAREGELCQLRLADIRKDDALDLWCIDINERGENRVKTDTSVRVVPLHPTVLSLGFIEYVRTCSEGSQDRLFPNEERNTRGEFGAFSKRFNRFKEGLGLKSDKDQKLDFHSFRHTMQYILYGKGCEEYVVNAICGHGNTGRSEGVRTYSQGPGLRAMHDTLMKLEFGVDFTTVKSNGWR